MFLREGRRQQYWEAVKRATAEESAKGEKKIIQIYKLKKFWKKGMRSPRTKRGRGRT